MPEMEVWVVSNGAYWKAVWTAPDGSRRGRSLGAKAKLSRRQARVKARQIAAGDGAEDADVPKLSAWLEQFIAGRRVRKNTTATYRECGITLRAWFEHDPPINKISRAEAATWRDDLLSGEMTAELNRMAAADPQWENKSTKTWRRPSESTVARHVRAAKLIFKEATSRDLIGSNPFDRLVGAPPRIDRDWKDVTPADTKRILDACPGAGWRALFALCRFAGLRLGEAVALRWEDVDWAGNRIRVNAGAERATTKKRRRVAPIEPARCPSGLTALLRETFEAAPDGAVKVCHGIPANNLRRDAIAILKRSGVGAYAKPFHTLRKCCETTWASQYPQHVVSDWIGHDITVSARHYLRVPEELYAAPAPSVQVGYDAGKNSERTREVIGEGQGTQPIGAIAEGSD